MKHDWMISEYTNICIKFWANAMIFEKSKQNDHPTSYFIQNQPGLKSKASDLEGVDPLRQIRVENKVRFLKFVAQNARKKLVFAKLHVFEPPYVSINVRSIYFNGISIRYKVYIYVYIKIIYETWLDDIRIY